MGSIAVPSAKASTEPSGPVRNSSTTTWFPDAPKILSSMMECSAAAASCSFWAMITPFAQSQTVRFDHRGYFPCFLMYPRASPASVNTSYSAVGIPYFSSGLWKTPCCSQFQLLWHWDRNRGTLLPPAYPPFLPPAGHPGQQLRNQHFFLFAKASIPS